MGLQSPTISVEGQYMLEGLLNDLNHVDTDYLINKNSEITNDFSNCNPMVVDKELSTWLDENIANYDACFPVAPEEDHILYRITKALEENGVEIIGSSSDAVLACSDKFETYNLLKNDLPMIECEKVFFNDLKKYKCQFSSGRKMLIKPADGVSCSGVWVVRSYADFIKASAHLKRTTNLPFFLLQKYVEGVSTSVSILSTGKNAMPLSLNLQKIGLNHGKLIYNGGKVPYKHKLSDDAKDISKKAAEYINGLKGYVGVDLLLDEANDEIYILEINPRLTTSYVALRRILNFNLGEAIIDAVSGILPSEVEFKDSLNFQKEDDIIFK
jgi:predicted ATP-grasp superfamily ATP-dependent carboligase